MRGLVVHRLPAMAAAFALLVLLVLSGAALAQDGREVKVGAYVTSLSDVDSADGSYRIALYVWFDDPSGTFDVARDLYLLAREFSVEDVEVEPAPDGGTYTYARIEALVPQEFDFTHFPFDRQRLVLRMEASEDETDLRFVPDTGESGVSDYLPLRGWQVEDMTISVESHDYDTDFGYWEPASPYSQVLIAIDASRARSPVLVAEFLGFTFAFLITCLTFFVSCTELGLRIGMSTGSLFAAVVNLNRLHDAAGFRPGFALVDRLAFLVFGAIVVALFVSISTNRLARHIAPARANRIDSAIGFVVMMTFAVVIALTLGRSLGS